MRDWLTKGIPRNIAEDPDMGVVGRIRDSLRRDNGQTCDSSMLAPCPFCGYETPFILTSSIGDCTEEARVVCPSCHVSTTRDGQSWRVSYRGDDITRALAIGRAISRWNRRAERTCRMEQDPDYDFVRCSACGYEEESNILVAVDEGGLVVYGGNYCPHCGAKVVDDD